MNIVGELKCFHCGRVVGELLSRLDRPEEPRRFRRAGGELEVALAARQRVGCPRCGGPTYVDDIRTVRPVEDWRKSTPRYRRQTQGSAEAWPRTGPDQSALKRAAS